MADRKKNRPEPGPIRRPNRQPTPDGEDSLEPEEVEQLEQERPVEDARYEDVEDAEYTEEEDFAESTGSTGEHYGTPEEEQGLSAEEYQHQGRQARGGPVLKNPITREMVDRKRPDSVANLRGRRQGTGGGSSKSRNDKAVIIFFSVALALVIIALVIPESWIRPGAEEAEPAEFAPEDVGWDKLDNMHERMVETEKRELRRREEALRQTRINLPTQVDTDILEEDYAELLEPLPGESGIGTGPSGSISPETGMRGDALMRGNPGSSPGQSPAGLPSSPAGDHTRNLPPLDAGTQLPPTGPGSPGIRSALGTSSGLSDGAVAPPAVVDPEQQKRLQELEAEIEQKLQSQGNSNE